MSSHTSSMFIWEIITIARFHSSYDYPGVVARPTLALNDGLNESGSVPGVVFWDARVSDRVMILVSGGLLVGLRARSDCLRPLYWPKVRDCVHNGQFGRLLFLLRISIGMQVAACLIGICNSWFEWRFHWIGAEISIRNRTFFDSCPYSHNPREIL